MFSERGPVRGVRDRGLPDGGCQAEHLYRCARKGTPELLIHGTSYMEHKFLLRGTLRMKRKSYRCYMEHYSQSTEH